MWPYNCKILVNETCTLSFIQLEQEIDLILAKKDVAKTAAKDWQTKWTPAILQHSATLTGKQGAMYKQNQKACQGGYSIIHMYKKL